MQHSWYRAAMVISGLLGTVLAQAPDTALATEPLKVLIDDGANNHDWPRATRILREILVGTGRFAVEVTTSPSADASAADWAQWRPKFADYDVVVSNFNGGHKPESLHWPKEVERALEEYVRGGGGLVIFHSANNSFPNWPAYNEMIGLGWRNKEFGPSLIVDADEQVVRIPTGEGLNPGHGPDHDFLITVLDRDHPITKGLPKRWMHPTEQLTHGQHGPADHVHVLTYAFSRDTKQNEVVDWVVPYGKGRVFVTMQGHLWRDKTDVNLRCLGFRTILARGTEWAATGEVTLPVPKDFPTETEIQVVEPTLAGLFDVRLRKAEDRLALHGDSEFMALCVTSKSGIGQAEMRRIGTEWPETVVLRLNLGGLEQLTIVNEDVELTLNISVPSHGESGQSLQVSRDGKTTEVGRESPFFTKVQLFGKKLEHRSAIPLREGCQLEIPAAMLEGNPAQLSIRWIDFFRS